MDPSLPNRFFALVTVLILAGDAGLLVVLAGRRGVLRRAGEWLDEVLGGATLWLAWVVAVGALAGSLFYSEIVGFRPCQLCWYQRLAWYPLVLVLLIAAIRRSLRIATWALPLVAVGWGLSVYHYTIQLFPALDAGACTTEVPCTVRWIWEFGFISIPLMSFAGLTLVGLLLLWARRNT
ncbi:MAG: disulfide bond formation protein B [Acidimicrobiia bacterium]